MSLRVDWISHCPVKGLAVQQLDQCDLTEAGIAGDRELFLVDRNDRLVNSKGLVSSSRSFRTTTAKWAC